MNYELIGFIDAYCFTYLFNRLCGLPYNPSVNFIIYDSLNNYNVF